jgi:hypothetical protein
MRRSGTVTRWLKILYPKLSAAIVTFLWGKALISNKVRWEGRIPGSCPVIPEELG